MKHLRYLLIPMIITFVFSKTNATNPDSTYCFWYDLSIDFWENLNRKHYTYTVNSLKESEIRQNWDAASKIRKDCA